MNKSEICGKDSHSIPSLHDATLLGMTMESERQVVILFKTEVGHFFKVTLEGIARLRADNFREANIVLDLSVENFPSKDDVLFACSVDDELRHPEFVKSIVAKIEAGELMLVQINASYGCRLACVCAGWSIVEAVK